MSAAIKVLTKPTGASRRQHLTRVGSNGQHDEKQIGHPPPQPQTTLDKPREELGLPHLKSGYEAKPFKLIHDRDWNIVSTEPASETNFFVEGHSALSVVSAIGTLGSGKSTLLNKLARRNVFITHNVGQLDLNHQTRGVEVYSTHHRILVDSQPVLSSSVLGRFISGLSRSQFADLTEPLTCCQMIDLQLVTFLMATSDYVVIVCDWLIDVHLLKLLSSAIMMIGEPNLRAKLLLYCENSLDITSDSFRKLVESFLGRNRIDGYFDSCETLYSHIAAYSREKLDLYSVDDRKFTGKNWLESCSKLWNVTIKNSSMFTDYASQLSETGV